MKLVYDSIGHCLRCGKLSVRMNTLKLNNDGTNSFINGMCLDCIEDYCGHTIDLKSKDYYFRIKDDDIRMRKIDERLRGFVRWIDE